jgi:hypothetical protein
VIQQGDGEGERLVPIEHTSKPIDPDLVVDAWKLPVRQRLSIIINELGTGLAGQGDALRQAIRNADPTLKELDKVVQILAGQNRVLADLAHDSDQVLAPLARERSSVTGFISNGQKAAEATAERRAALEETIRRLPPFLRQLRPTMDRLGGLADQFTPVLDDVGSVAPDVNRFVTRLEPFSRASLPAFRTLGAAADRGRPVLKQSEPFFKTLRDFTLTGQLLGLDLRNLTTSLRDTGGIEGVMDFFHYLAGSTNGFDQFGHYFRIGLRTITACLDYKVEKVAACNATWSGPKPEDAVKEAESEQQSASGNAEAAARAASAGGAQAQAQAQDAAAAPSGSSSADGSGPATASPSTGPASGSAPASSTDTALLDYLMGG